MGLVEILVLAIAIWICVYSLFERVCRCKETCALYQAYAAFLSVSKDSPNNKDDIVQFLKAMSNTGGNNKQS